MHYKNQIEPHKSEHQESLSNTLISLLTRSFKDFLTPTMLGISFLPFILSFTIFLSIFFMYAAEIGSTMSSSINSEADALAVPFLSFIAGTAIAQALFAILAQFLFFIPMAIGSMIFAVIVVGFLTPYIVRVLHKRYYGDLELVGYGSLASDALFMLVTFLKMLLLIVLLFPTWFIPLLQLVTFFVPFYYFFHSILNRDVSGTIINKDERIFFQKQHKWNLIGLTAMMYAISLIPIFGVLLQPLYVIVLTHWYFAEVRKYREAGIWNKKS